jgi:hypothetical protein
MASCLVVSLAGTGNSCPESLTDARGSCRLLDMETTTKRTKKQGTGSWYTERGTYTEPSEVPGMVKLMRAGKFLAFVPTKED